MGDNLKIRKLRADVANVFNQSTLPPELKRMIAKEILVELTKLADEFVRNEEQEMNQEKESESNGISSDN